ncbi:hypothetical protein OEV98_01445 [Caldibacillus lycopersici]|uniref:Uncharacterized protein n=1 Tax=Perspicuibacillus lycopersici TaxID=1325689 RepID=A0AAE3IT28_9BACI|nr:hypothetical protein [Perspicuibacillus lycopersici]MCU9612224.1 hypothetical protein [Perspicuibacillus lycopersici]
MRSILFVLLLLLTTSCSKDIPDPEVKNEKENIDPIQMEYDLNRTNAYNLQ